MESERVDFSVIVPTYARPRQLAACLESLARLDYPRDRFEILVVDDGSGTPPEALTASFRDRLDVTLLTQRHAGPAAARNAGAARARGRFLVFTDDDCLPAPDWLRRLEAAFEHTPDHMLGGRTLNRLTGNPYATASQVILEAVYAFYNPGPTAVGFFASNNLALPAGLFRTVGGFDETFPLAAGEDREFCDRWRQRGYRMAYIPEAVVLHAHPLTFRTFCKQYFNYGRGALRYHRLRAQLASGTMAQDLSLHARILPLVREPISRLPRRQVVSVGVLLMVWELANAAGFFYEKYAG
jgi:GT2 family glycosyltransferase